MEENAKVPAVAARRRFDAKKWSKWALIAIGIYAIYPISVTLALMTGLVEKLVASEDLRLEIDAPAWSLLPGDVHMGRVRIFMNGETQFILSADNLTAQIRLLPLFRRRFEVSSLATKNVIFQMRVQLDESQAESPRARAFPPLEGLPGNPTVSRQVAEQTEERSPSWTIRLEGIDAKVQELWFLEYRYRGDGRLKGGFVRGPNVLRVDTSVQDLGPGLLTFGAEQVISKNFQGQVEATIPELDPAEHADTSFFEYVIARVALRADLETLAHVGAYIPRHPKVSGGAGPLDVKVKMLEGLLAPESAISFATSDVTLSGHGYGVKTDWKLAIGMEGEGAAALPHVDSTSQATYVSLASPGKESFTIQVLNHHESATLDSAKIGAATEVKSARIHLPQIVSKDLDDLDGLLTGKAPVSAQGGQVEANLTLTLDSSHRMTGPFRARFEDATLTFDRLQTRANGSASCSLSVDPDGDRARVSDLSILVRPAHFRAGDETVSNWWLNLESERIDVVGLPADDIRADFSIFARDAEPVIRALAADGKVPGFVADIIHLRNLKVMAKLRRTERTTDIMLDTLESKFIDFSGRVFRSPKESRLALLVGGKDVAVGIAQDGKNVGFDALASEDWLNRELTHFPEPRRYVSGEKP